MKVEIEISDDVVEIIKFLPEYKLASDGSLWSCIEDLLRNYLKTPRGIHQLAERLRIARGVIDL